MKQFNIRVYGLLINENNEVLLVDEFRKGVHFTKFPGGGLEWGEGTKACLKRELTEETGLGLEIGELFYLTDFFQESAFNSNDQLISVYYRVHYADCENLLEQLLPSENLSAGEVFHWKSIAELTTESVTFPVDRVVVTKLKEAFSNPLF